MKAICLFLLCGVAGAQTWDYSGAVMTGGETVGNYGGLGSTSVPISEAFNAEIVIAGSQMSYALTLGGQAFLTGQGVPMDSTSWGIGQFSRVAETFTNGAVSGLTMFQNDTQGNGAGGYVFNITPTGDSLNFTSGNPGGAGGSYELLTLSNNTPGTWASPTMAAPEIDPSQSFAMFALLAGGLAVIRGKRRSGPVETLSV